MTKSTLKKSVRGVVADPLQIQPRDIALLRDVWEFERDDLLKTSPFLRRAILTGEET